MLNGNFDCILAKRIGFGQNAPDLAFVVFSARQNAGYAEVA